MRLDEAIDHFEQAREATDQLAARTMNTRARYYLAEALVMRGQKGDVARSMEEAATAITMCLQMGQQGVADRLLALQERVGRMDLG
jgi:hypothetical protein